MGLTEVGCLSGVGTFVETRFSYLAIEDDNPNETLLLHLAGFLWLSTSQIARMAGYSCPVLVSSLVSLMKQNTAGRLPGRRAFWRAPLLHD